ncbi:hypothetical protein ES705_33518 [subsurface metagenome]
MEKKENNLLSQNQTSSSNFSWILDELPYGISVQDTNRTILYENKKVKELLGTYMGTQCFKRWTYIPGEGQNPCQDCMMSLIIKDKIEACPKTSLSRLKASLREKESFIGEKGK